MKYQMAMVDGLTVVRGDLISAFINPYINVGVIAHGVNTKLTHGGGFARILDEQIGYELSDYNTKIPTSCIVPGGRYTMKPSKIGGVVYNLFTQIQPGPDAKHETIADAITGLSDAEHDSFHIPLIGGGIGGLDPLDCLRNIQDAARKLSESSDKLVVLWLLPGDFEALLEKVPVLTYGHIVF